MLINPSSTREPAAVTKSRACHSASPVPPSCSRTPGFLENLVTRNGTASFDTDRSQPRTFWAPLSPIPCDVSGGEQGGAHRTAGKGPRNAGDGPARGATRTGGRRSGGAAALGAGENRPRGLGVLAGLGPGLAIGSGHAMQRRVVKATANANCHAVVNCRVRSWRHDSPDDHTDAPRRGVQRGNLTYEASRKVDGSPNRQITQIGIWDFTEQQLKRIAERARIDLNVGHVSE